MNSNDDFETIRHYSQAGSQGILDTVTGIHGNNMWNLELSFAILDTQL